MNPVMMSEENALHENASVYSVTNMSNELYEAVILGSTNRFKSLLHENADVLQQVTPMKDNAMHIAAEFGHLEICKAIHSSCARLLCEPNLVGDTPLHRAARAGHCDIVSHFINPPEKSLDVEIEPTEAIIHMMTMVNGEKDTIMHEAVRNRHFDIVELLIKQHPQLLGMINYAGESPLHVAVKRKNANIVRQILENPRYISYQGPSGETALHTAIALRTPGITKLLLEKIPELTKEADDNKRTPLHLASTMGFLEDVRTLLKCDTSTTCYQDKDGYAPIHIAVQFGKLDIIKEFTRVQPYLKYMSNGEGQNLLHIAVQYQQLSVVKFILREKYFEGLLNGKDKLGNTPLHQATIVGNPYIVNILANDDRIDVSSCNRNGCTSLAIARSQAEESDEYEQRVRALVFGTLLHAEGQNPRIMMNEISKYRIKRISTHYSIKSYKERANTLLIVTTLVATVTFAAGLAIPGGYVNDGQNQGMAILQNHAPFARFVVLDAVAMYFSVGAVFALILVQLVENVQIVHGILVFAEVLTYAALTFMGLGFMTAVNMTISESNMMKTVVWLLGFLHTVIGAALFVAIIQFEYSFVLLNKRSVFLLSWLRECFRES